MKILICGGREFSDMTKLNRAMSDYEGRASLVITGAAHGADRMGSNWAKRLGLPLAEFPAHWTTHGKAAGPRRNSWMLAFGKPDLVIAFEGGRGTADMVRQAKAAGVEVKEVE